MSFLSAFLSASIGNLTKKALVALGLGTITYTGLQQAFDAAQSQVISNYGAMSGGTLAIVDLAGGGQVIGILLGAVSARIGMMALSHIGKVL